MYPCLTVLAICMAYDIVSGRIPRKLTLAGFFVSQTVVFADTRSARSAVYSLLSGILILVLLYPIFAIGGMGAGDLKVMMFLPGFLGTRYAFYAIAYAFVAGALIGSIVLIRRGILLKRIRYLLTYIKRLNDTGKLTPYVKFPREYGETTAYTIHFMIPLFLGVIAVYGGKLIR